MEIHPGKGVFKKKEVSIPRGAKLPQLSTAALQGGRGGPCDHRGGWATWPPPSSFSDSVGSNLGSLSSLYEVLSLPEPHPIFPSGCEGKLGVALESLQGRRDLT